MAVVAFFLGIIGVVLWGVSLAKGGFGRGLTALTVGLAVGGLTAGVLGMAWGAASNANMIALGIFVVVGGIAAAAGASLD